MKKDDRHRFDTQSAESPRAVEARLLVKRALNRSIEQHALWHFHDQPRRNWSLGLAPHEQILFARNLMPADLKHVTKARRHQHTGARAFPFQDRIGRDGRAVEYGGDCGWCCAGKSQNLLDALEEAVGWVPWRRRNLGGPQRTRLSINHDDVCERAADVERQLKPRHVALSIWICDQRREGRFWDMPEIGASVGGREANREYSIG